MENIRSPKTKQAMKIFSTNARKRRSEETCTETKPSPSTSTVKKPKRLSNSDVSDFMVKNNIRKESELMQVALQRSTNGEKDLQGFILNKTPKALADLICTTWRMQEAAQTVAREKTTRIEVIRNHAKGECVPNCNGEWFRCAKEVLRNNNINIFYFVCALRNCFIKGRQKISTSS